MRTLALTAILLGLSVAGGCRSNVGRIDPDCLIEDGLTAKEVGELRTAWFGSAFALPDSVFTAEKFIPGEGFTGMAYYPLTATRAQEVEFKAGIVVGVWMVRQRKS